MFPNENLCPPIPGRADYIHHIADLLSINNNKQIKSIALTSKPKNDKFLSIIDGTC